ncbi:hypothetical protein LUZ60_004613 [Juncus effusus]|nr:hypothetical protein LUZ60_004613 [Juncus effusus]
MVQIRYVNVNGVNIYLPNGFRFMPSESELVLQYLSKRMLSIPLPLPDYIYPQIDLRLFDPWELPGEDDDDDDEKYYFTTVGPVVPLRGRNLVRPTVSGVWRMKGAEVAVISEDDDRQGVEVQFREYYVVKIERKVRRGRRQDNNGDDRESCIMSMEEGEDSS